MAASASFGHSFRGSDGALDLVGQNCQMLGQPCEQGEYHQPTIAEPHELDDAQVRAAFNKCELYVVVSRTGREMFTEMASRYDLIQSEFAQSDRFGQERYATWAGTKT
ncbi:hypothetical protein M2171_005570 [Bradyrhizobium japonicum USDA 38]|uniref:hypothetical protein n=1 Tax=Bradyrhizobium japonicum TaxID=375 RepID=UPI0004200C19|nr:hypothetical protein [Bradyrhizobium japonicum]MCS3896437.1 hypothetical protein [Bradyrhizobium japonicum USDA 38]MCS3948952.1 hypothetical protein [Bradyrhizobium japonicum]